MPREAAPGAPSLAHAPALAVRDVHKSFRIPHSRHTTLLERAAHPLRGDFDVLHALRGVSFEAARGEFLGIVGRNGSGKSTLLKIAAGIYQADRGRVEVSGRLSPVIELGVGFRPDLSARDNVLLGGALLGIPAADLKARLQDILVFADVENLAEVKLKNYSSGMSVRLAFSLAIHARADVLLVDEVLAVGDASFRAKCFRQFERMRREGRTVVLVSHDMSAIERYCDRAVLLEKGRVEAIGEPAEVAERYREANRRRDAEREDLEQASAALAAAPRRTAEDVAAAPPATYTPSALGDDLRHLARLSGSLAEADIRVHYQDSALGYVWSVMRPLGLFAVIYFVFSKAAGLGAGVENYALYLLTAIVLWTFFAEGTALGLVSLHTAQPMLRKMRMPRLAIPAAVMLRALFNLTMNFVAVGVIYALVGLEPHASWLQLPLLVFLLGLLTAGLAMLLSTLYVRFRDISQAWQVIQQLLFFASPILFVAARYPDSVQDVLDLSPLAAIFTQMRHALIDPSAPTAAEAAGGAGMLLVPLALIAGTFALGLWAFQREAPRAAERI